MSCHFIIYMVNIEFGLGKWQTVYSNIEQYCKQTTHMDFCSIDWNVCPILGTSDMTQLDASGWRSVLFVLIYLTSTLIDLPHCFLGNIFVLPSFQFLQFFLRFFLSVSFYNISLPSFLPLILPARFTFTHFFPFLPSFLPPILSPFSFSPQLWLCGWYTTTCPSGQSCLSVDLQRTFSRYLLWSAILYMSAHTFTFESIP